MVTEYYDQKADSFYKDTVKVDMANLYLPFLALLPAGAHILDAGCGSGRDSKVFTDKGYRVTTFDASIQMVKRASKLTGLAVEHKRFDQLTDVSIYDGIWACASLLHVPWANLPDIIKRLERALKPHGAWYMSFKYGEGERQEGSRHFTDLNEAHLKTLMAKLESISINQTWITNDKRPGRDDKWLNSILLKY